MASLGRSGHVERGRGLALVDQQLDRDAQHVLALLPGDARQCLDAALLQEAIRGESGQSLCISGCDQLVLRLRPRGHDVVAIGKRARSLKPLGRSLAAGQALAEHARSVLGDEILGNTTAATDFYDGEEDIFIPITDKVGDFSGCVQVEEISQLNEAPFPLHTEEPTNKVWCPDVGLIYDTSDGALTESNATNGRFKEKVEDFKEEHEPDHD